MPSLKSHLVAFILKSTRKKAFMSPENLHAWLARVRPQNPRPPERLARRVAFAERRVDGMAVYDVTPLSGRTGGPRIVYMHGGAYCFEITPHHWRMVAEMAERLDARVTVPIYPLAPEHTFPEIFGPVFALYRDLLNETPPEDIVFMGDSAGGNMAVVLTMMAAEAGLPAPGSHVLISPGLDMSMTNPEIFEAVKNDPWLGIPGGLEAIRLYAPDIDHTDWRISPTYGELAVLPRTLLLAGTRDTLTPDNIVFARKARAAGVDLELVVEKGMIHVWPLIDMPEARRARDRIVEFLSRPRPPAAERPAEPETRELYPAT